MKWWHKLLVIGAVLLFFSLIFRSTWTVTSTIEFGLELPTVTGGKVQPLNPVIPENNTASVEDAQQLEEELFTSDEVLDFIRLVESQKGGFNDNIFPPYNEAIAKYLKNNLIPDYFYATYKCKKTDSNRFYIEAPNGEKVLIQDEPVIYGYSDTGYDKTLWLAIYDSTICVVSESYSVGSPYGKVWVHTLYPLKDAYLSSIGQYETTYDPEVFTSFRLMMKFIEYYLTPLD